MQKEMDNNGVRRGAWTKEEDILLRNCIEKYGEGNWHKVPPRAGLNRCRKSCRLRWLNYLRPNLKRGYFNKDEVDLILRLHKLLGNRWSLIAGRLPGRTANDVKNFWNTHMVKKSAAVGESCKGKTTPKNINENNIIKPRPRTFSKLQAPICPSEITKTSEPNNENIDNNNEPFSTVSPLQHPVNNYENPNKKQQPCSSSQEGPNDWTNSVENPVNNQPFQLSQEEVDECIQWWSNLLEITENGEGVPLLFSDEDDPITQPIFSSGLSGHENNVQTNQDGLSSSSVDVDVWELMNFDDQ